MTTNRSPVPSNAVVELLEHVGNGIITPTLEDPQRSWREIDCGDIAFNVGGWRVVVFNDCDGFDYIDSVRSPDGSEGEFEDWFGPVKSDGTQDSMQPDDLLCLKDPACFRRMVEAFRSAV